jgi:hypothetical protein
MAIAMIRAVVAAAAAASTLVVVACGPAGPVGEERRLLVDVCMAYDDLRGRDDVKLGSEPEIQELHAIADAACDQVADRPRAMQ